MRNCGPQKSCLRKDEKFSTLQVLVEGLDLISIDLCENIIIARCIGTKMDFRPGKNVLVLFRVKYYCFELSHCSLV